MNLFMRRLEMWLDCLANENGTALQESVLSPGATPIRFLRHAFEWFAVFFHVDELAFAFATWFFVAFNPIAGARVLDLSTSFNCADARSCTSILCHRFSLCLV